MRRPLPFAVVFLVVAIVTVAAVVCVYVLGLRVASANAEIIRSQKSQADVRQLLSLLQDAETGQRGFLIIGEDQYLEPYHRAIEDIPEQLAILEQDAKAGLISQEVLDRIQSLTREKLDELAQTIALRRSAGMQSAVDMVHTDKGMYIMADIRTLVASLEKAGQERQARLIKRRDDATWLRTTITWVGALVTLLFIGWAYVQVSRSWRQQVDAIKTAEDSRQRLDGIVSSAMDAIISIDENQKIILYNVAAEQMFRCPAQAAIGSDLNRFIPQRFRTAHTEHVRRFAETGQTRRAMGGVGLALSGLRADGEEFPIDASISQVLVGGQRILTVVLRDITERRKAEDEIRVSARKLAELNATLERRVVERTSELAEANRELEAFGYTVSHDLRAPLRHVTSFVELLDRHAGATLDEKGRRYLNTIADAGRRMGSLIDDLLMLSRVGRATVTFVDVSLHQLLQEAMVQLAPEIAGRKIEWKIGELPRVKGDPSLLRSVMVNLLSNAIKYTRTRPVAIVEVGSRTENSQIICYVKDNGVGFDMRFADKLFGVFQRLHRLEEFEGTGVGLASVRRIVTKHGGRTWAEGEVDSGATFYFSLPAVSETASETEGP